MTTSVTADIVSILDRVGKLDGWTVERGSNGLFKVTNPAGESLTAHDTPSNPRGAKNLVTRLNRIGLDDAMAAAEQAEQEQRLARIDADRKVNDKRAAAVARAAGAYAPSPVTIGEILGTHPSPRVYNCVPITTEMAKAILDRNRGNRPIRAGDIARWCRILRAGRWRYTHQGVALDVNGYLQDGQHRLTAIAETGITADMMISVGMPVENFSVVDSGRRRTAAQVIGMQGVAYASTIAAAVRLLHLHITWGPTLLDHASDRVDNDEVALTYDELDADLLDAAARWAYRLRGEIGVAPAGITAAYYLIAESVGPDNAHLLGFAERLVRSPGTDDKAPLYVLRRTLTRQASGVARKLTPAQQMVLVIKAWNAHHEGRTAAYLTVREGTECPAVRIPKD